MCGVFLKYSLHGSAIVEPNDHELLQRCSHRGPDNSTLEIFSGAVIGFNRLAIRSISEGGQPYVSRYHKFISCFNGELYNAKEVRKSLLSRMEEAVVPFGDMQLLPEYLAEFGLGNISNLEGMFAGFILFPDSSKLILFRDRVGEKPLYFSIQQNFLYVASELHSIPSPILSDFAENRDQYVRGFWRGQGTPFQNIWKVSPGSYVTFDLLTFSNFEQNYWSWERDIPKRNPLRKSSTNEVAKIKNQIKQSVRKQLIAEVPICAFLSGGLDSAAVVSNIPQYFRQEMQTFTINFEGGSFSEDGLAAKSAQYLGVKNQTIKLSSTEIARLIPKVIDAMDIPIFDPACLGLFALSNISSGLGYKVALTGDGGDELFRGYRIYNFTRLLSLLTISPAMFDFFLSMIIRVHRPSDGYLNWRMMALRARDVIKYPQFSIPEIALSPFSGTPLLDILITEKTQGKRSYMTKRELDISFESYFRNYILAEIYLAKSDRMSMRNSQEVRSPLLDPSLLDLIRGFESSGIKLPTKRRIMSSILGVDFPGQVISARKHGFGIPLSRALREMTEPDWNFEKIGINSQVASRVWKHVVDGDESQAHAIWATLVLNNFIERDVVRSV